MQRQHIGWVACAALLFAATLPGQLRPCPASTLHAQRRTQPLLYTRVVAPAPLLACSGPARCCSPVLSWSAEASAVCTEPVDLLKAQDAVHDVDAASLRQHLWGALQQSPPAEAGPIEALAQCMKELWDASVPDPNLCTFLRDEQQPKLVLDPAKPVMFLGAFQVRQ